MDKLSLAARARVSLCRKALGFVSVPLGGGAAAAALGDLTELFPINQLKLTGLKYQRVRPGCLQS